MRPAVRTCSQGRSTNVIDSIGVSAVPIPAHQPPSHRPDGVEGQAIPHQAGGDEIHQHCAGDQGCPITPHTAYVPRLPKHDYQDRQQEAASDHPGRHEHGKDIAFGADLRCGVKSPGSDTGHAQSHAQGVPGNHIREKPLPGVRPDPKRFLLERCAQTPNGVPEEGLPRRL